MPSDPSTPDLDAAHPQAGDQGSKKSSWWGLNSISVAGLLFIYSSVVIFGAVVYLLIKEPNRTSLEQMYSELLLSVIAAFVAFLGVGLVRVAGLASSVPNSVINPTEWEILKDEVKSGKEDAITQYIRLSSLSGLTGGFTKLGLQGLPLATIGITLFFCLLSLKDEKFLELAKLTLGAFIGSFVQKQVGANQGGGTVQLPSGEKVKVTREPPTVA